ncbi:hypothetical protein JMJ56_00620 [Belnapia sp. T18]|uniref:Secreted protein n=1 Tax=Belnapia arida TaxID=2804533 RepID=A0ABS1TVV1_9PROT|nr:hypothetical protein [Belnapia arida]MBL6076484.1 hypothetical protein [Belnapia arida]
MQSLVTPPALLLVLAMSASAEPGPRVTTDTVEYCGSLAARLAGMPAAAQEPSRRLAAEGMRLCGNGHVRVGIAKLRRAVRAAQANTSDR